MVLVVTKQRSSWAMAVLIFALISFARSSGKLFMWTFALSLFSLQSDSSIFVAFYVEEVDNMLP